MSDVVRDTARLVDRIRPVLKTGEIAANRMPPPRNIADRMDFRGAECREEFVADETVVDLEP